MAYEEGGNLKQKEIWHDYYSNYPNTGYRPIYKGNFVFSVYDGNDYELYLYMGDTTNCVPAIPEGVHYTTSMKSNGVQLFWEEAEDAAFYRIYKSASSHNYGSYYAETSDTFYIDTNMIGNTMYYSISSMRGNKESGLSKQITVNEFDTIGPIAPESLRITNIDTLAMKLSLEWKKSLSTDVEKYLLYKKTGIYDVFHLYDSTENDITVYNDSNIQFGINYFYKISARDYNGNEGSYSNEADTTVVHSSGIISKKVRQFSIRYATIQSNGIFLFKLINGVGKRIDASIYDLSGRTIYKKVITPSKANVTERVNIKKSGVYFIKFKYNKNRYVKKIVIL
ncbi:MAG: T9SS type A sorting domain-containing protein [Proteobacteria bacterium]|nr:T9SS type A sorting domain-containing protein [Pseudomonadota bacterium]